MMTFEEYKRYYWNLTNFVLGGNEANLSIKELSLAEKSNCFNNLYGLTILALITFIESNFLTKRELRSLRNFEETNSIPSEIHQSHLSCFIYIRDCFAHNPSAYLLPPATNTEGFLSVIGNFSGADVFDDRILIKPNSIHQLHLIIRILYGK